ncbi:MAG: isomerase, partial [Gammaproteobacteria bacterium]|nr:isomerase [Gammaproteobacteria bacterium]
TALRARQISHRGGELRCELNGTRVLIGGQCVAFLTGEIELI